MGSSLQSKACTSLSKSIDRTGFVVFVQPLAMCFQVKHESPCFVFGWIAVAMGRFRFEFKKCCVRCYALLQCDERELSGHNCGLMPEICHPRSFLQHELHHSCPDLCLDLIDERPTWAGCYQHSLRTSFDKGSTSLFGPSPDEPVIDFMATSTLWITTLSISVKATSWMRFSTVKTALSTGLLILRQLYFLYLVLTCTVNRHLQIVVLTICLLL